MKKEQTTRKQYTKKLRKTNYLNIGGEKTACRQNLESG